MDNLRRLGNTISIDIPKDKDGFTGRECPQKTCEGYFKIEFGTGLKGEGLPCHCPYCGYTAGHDQFWTKAQIEYAKSVAMRKFTDAVYKGLKGLEFDYKPRGSFGIGISMKVQPRHPTPIRYYREKRLETEVVCANCTLRYSIYGVFAFCPDCGQHNSLQILEKNLELVGKMLDLAAGAENEIAERLVENALEDCVSAFDGFGRELCRVYKNNSSDPANAVQIRFQNLEGAKANLLRVFSIDLSAILSADEWQAAVRGFQKRHLVAHKMGVVDHDYIEKTRDARAVVGRKIDIGPDEVRGLLHSIGELARGLSISFREAAKFP